MAMDNTEEIRLLNTAIIKLKEKNIDPHFENNLFQTCQKPAVASLGLAISHLSETLNISRDQAVFQIVELIRELDVNWTDYLLMEGVGKVKETLKGN
jgi:hypothetical protein